MIAVDWGTSSFRAWRLAADGTPIEQRSAAAGLLACNGAFEAVLAQQVQGWSDGLVVMAGMIGSRSGWLEVPYATAPAGIEDIAAGLREVPAPSLGGRRVWIAPGLVHRADGAPPEVMRGEETQILGLPEAFETGVHRLCLPGTHSKWVELQHGSITGWRTAMTGELYALLRKGSILAQLMPEDAAQDADDPVAFARGVADSARGGGLPHHLFGVRTLGLFGALAKHEGPSYLSGLLIGHELRAMQPEAMPADPSAPPVHLIGGEGLLRRYERAFGLLGRPTAGHGEALAARGLHRLARERGLLA